MKLTRRDLGKLAVAAIPGVGAFRAHARPFRAAWAQRAREAELEDSPACRSA